MKQRIVYDPRAGEVRTTVADGFVPLEGPVTARRAGVAVPRPDGSGYVLFTADGKRFDQDNDGRPFLTKRAVDLFEEQYVREQLLSTPLHEHPGLNIDELKSFL